MEAGVENTPKLQSYEYLFKVLIIGDQKAGKSCLLRRFVEDSFTDKYISTIGVDFMFKVVTLSGKTIKLQIWDTAGEERFRNITSSYYRGAHAVLILFDVTDRSTFDNLEKWLQSVSSQGSENCFVVLVGNKTDLSTREVTQEEGQALAEKHGVGYTETSARNRVNVDEPFLYVTKKMLQSKGTNIVWWKNSKFS